jgi:hypothetical protein
MSITIDQLVEVKLNKEDDFLKIRETLTRIGIASVKEKKLFQSCHILHKQGRYYIVHFKELFDLDGKPTNFSDEDRARRNTISNLISQWDLVDLVDPSKTSEDIAPLNQIKVLPFKEKSEWELVAKYNIGRKK